jgi:hypothetical protein
VVKYLFIISFFLLRTCSLVLLVFCQASAQLLSASMIIYAHTVPHTSTSSMLLRPWFIVLVLAGAVERLFGVATGVAMERDWVVLVVPFDTFLVPSYVLMVILFNWVEYLLIIFLVCTVGRNK